LPSNNRRVTHTDAQGFVKYTVEMSTRAMIYISCFIEIGSGVQKLTGGGGLADIQHGDIISLLLVLKIRKVG
jgi:hypothetical protein